MITSLYQSLCNMETNIADRVALRWYDEKTGSVAVVHYAKYAQDLRRFVAFLRAEYGDVHGKRVAILARNSYEYVICMYGTVIAGAVAVPLNLGKDWDGISYELGLCASCTTASSPSGSRSWKKLTAASCSPWTLFLPMSPPRM